MGGPFFFKPPNKQFFEGEQTRPLKKLTIQSWLGLRWKGLKKNRIEEEEESRWLKSKTLRSDPPNQQRESLLRDPHWNEFDWQTQHRQNHWQTTIYTNNNGWCCCCCCPKTSHTHTFTLWWCVFFSSRLLFCLVGVTFYYKKIITTNPFHYILFLSHKSQSHCEYCNWKWINCNKSSCLFWYFI